MKRSMINHPDNKRAILAACSKAIDELAFQHNANIEAWEASPCSNENEPHQPNVIQMGFHLYIPSGQDKCYEMICQPSVALKPSPRQQPSKKSPYDLAREWIGKVGKRIVWFHREPWPQAE
jgi:hypothetical protein